MSSMSENNVFDHLRKTLRTQMNEMSDHISGGGCKRMKNTQNVAVLLKD